MIEDRDVDRFRRELRALVAKADDPEGFAVAVEIAAELERALCDQAHRLRQPVGHSPGFSWADLGRALNVSRQAAQQRFGKPLGRLLADVAPPGGA